MKCEFALFYTVLRDGNFFLVRIFGKVWKKRENGLQISMSKYEQVVLRHSWKSCLCDGRKYECIQVCSRKKTFYFGG